MEAKNLGDQRTGVVEGTNISCGGMKGGRAQIDATKGAREGGLGFVYSNGI